MNCPTLVIKKFGSSYLDQMHITISEFAFKGNDPKNHKEWKHFIKTLKEEYGETIFGVLILSKTINANICFSFMFIHRKNTQEEYLKFANEISQSKGKQFEDLIIFKN